MAREKIGKNVTLVLTDYQRSEVVRVSKKRNISQSAVYRMMLDLGFQCHKDMERVGIIRAVDFTYYVRKALKDKMVDDGADQTELL